MTENKRFVSMADTDLEISIKDNLTKKYPFSLVCENLDEFEPLLNEVINICGEMNKLWEQTQRFEDHNKRLMEENEQLKQQNKELKLDNDIKFWKHQFMMSYNTSQIIMHEISQAIDEGYEVSEEFQKYLNELKVQNDENKEKMERLGI